MTGFEMAKNESSMETQNHDEQAMSEDVVVETPQHLKINLLKTPQMKHPKCYVHNYGDLHDEIMEDPSLGKKYNTKDPHIQTVKEMPINCFKSLLNDDSMSQMFFHTQFPPKTKSHMYGIDLHLYNKMLKFPLNKTHQH